MNIYEIDLGNGNILRARIMTKAVMKPGARVATNVSALAFTVTMAQSKQTVEIDAVAAQVLLTMQSLQSTAAVAAPAFASASGAVETPAAHG